MNLSKRRTKNLAQTLVVLIACVGSSAAQVVGAGDCSEHGGVAALVHKHVICLDEVDRLAGPDGQAAQEALYEIRSKAAKALADRYLLEDEAKLRSKTPEALIREFTAAVPLVSDADISIEQLSFPKATLAHGDVTTRYQIAQSLELEERSAALDKFVEYLRKGSDFNVVLPEPGPRLFARPSKSIIGSANKPITITLFLDYDSRPSVELLRGLSKALWESPDTVANLSVKYLPARMEGSTLKAAEVSDCAAAAGKLEALQRAFLSGHDNTSTALILAADSIGLRDQKFTYCTNSSTTLLDIKTDVVEAKQSGVTTAPAVFIGMSPVRDPIIENILAKAHAVTNESAY